MGVEKVIIREDSSNKTDLALLKVEKDVFEIEQVYYYITIMLCIILYYFKYHYAERREGHTKHIAGSRPYLPPPISGLQYHRGQVPAHPAPFCEATF